MAAEESKMKNVVADSRSHDQEEESESKTRTDLGEKLEMKNVGVENGSSDQEEEANESKIGTDMGELKMKNAVDDNRNSGPEEEEENESKTRTDLGENLEVKNVGVENGSSDQEEEANESKTGTDLGESKMKNAKKKKLKAKHEPIWAKKLEVKNVVVENRSTDQEEEVNESIIGTDLGEESKMKKVVDDNGSSDQEEEEEIGSKTGTDLGISLEKLSLGPKKKLLVIPLGGFIVHHYGRFKSSKRPFCDEFLKFCFERFEVGLWSSGMEHNVEAILTQAIGEFKNKFLFIWGQKHCTKTGFKCLESVRKPLFLKELKYIWEKYSSYSASNTLLITAPDKALLNPPNTGIFPKEYDIKNRNNDDFLGKRVRKPLFLKELKYIWEKYSSYSASNTLLITAPDKALLNPVLFHYSYLFILNFFFEWVVLLQPNTGIFPKEYDIKNRNNDDFLVFSCGWKAILKLKPVRLVLVHVYHHRHIHRHILSMESTPNSSNKHHVNK
ncbi:hypothetical protein LXL04_032576 [Taraxacum kok-saghyz]